MDTNKTLEEQVKALQKQMGGMARLVKDIKSTVDNLEKKINVKDDKEIQEIVEAQQVIDAIIVANADAIKRIDKEMRDISEKQHVKEAKSDIIEKDSDDAVKVIKRKRCRYFNRGFCKYKNKCRFVHPNKICIIYLKNQTCNEKSCIDRHPKLCKWTKSSGGCKREDCDYLHSFGEETDTDTKNMDAPKDFKCEGCKYTWEDKSCVVEHFVEHKKVFFCLNCDDCIQHKANVFDEGWTLFDNEGYLRQGI